ncbi:MAG: hypothetical protein K2I48_09310 [Muribaculaceae bacterium]|nr:hypothetical protein [Muribaculaceae bacterium]
MATPPKIQPIDVELESGDLCWIDEIPAFSVAGDSLGTCTVSVEIDGVEIHTDRLYMTEQGASEFFIRDILREEMEAASKVFAVVTLTATNTVGSATFRLNVVYRSRIFAGTAATFCRANFLTLSPVRSIPAVRSDEIYYLQFPGETLTKVTETVTVNSVGTPEVATVSETVAAVNSYKLIRVLVPIADSSGESQPEAVSVSCGTRRATWYIVDGADNLFRFTNAFGVTENLYARASVASKLTVKGSVATIRARLLRYDVEETEEITATFAPAMGADIVRIGSLASAPNLTWSALIDNVSSGGVQIIVESFEAVDDEDPDKLPSPTLTFRTVDNTPRVTPPVAGRVHTTPHSSQYN